MAKSVYIAHIRAGNLANKLLMAHAHGCDGSGPEWERHSLQGALEEFDALASVMTAARDRLAAIRQAEGGE